eukprot:ANDGO_01499.mRNA.1 bacterial type voltage activated sodium channel
MDPESLSSSSSSARGSRRESVQNKKYGSKTEGEAETETEEDSSIDDALDATFSIHRQSLMWNRDDFLHLSESRKKGKGGSESKRNAQDDSDDSERLPPGHLDDSDGYDESEVVLDSRFADSRSPPPSPLHLNPRLNPHFLHNPHYKSGGNDGNASDGKNLNRRRSSSFVSNKSSFAPQHAPTLGLHDSASSSHNALSFSGVTTQPASVLRRITSLGASQFPVGASLQLSPDPSTSAGAGVGVVEAGEAGAAGNASTVEDLRVLDYHISPPLAESERRVSVSAKRKAFPIRPSREPLKSRSMSILQQHLLQLHQQQQLEASAAEARGVSGGTAHARSSVGEQVGIGKSIGVADDGARVDVDHQELHHRLHGETDRSTRNVDRSVSGSKSSGSALTSGHSASSSSVSVRPPPIELPGESASAAPTAPSVSAYESPEVLGPSEVSSTRPLIPGGTSSAGIVPSSSLSFHEITKKYVTGRTSDMRKRAVKPHATNRGRQDEDHEEKYRDRLKNRDDADDATDIVNDNDVGHPPHNGQSWSFDFSHNSKPESPTSGKHASSFAGDWEMDGSQKRHKSGRAEHHHPSDAVGDRGVQPEFNAPQKDSTLFAYNNAPRTFAESNAEPGSAEFYRRSRFGVRRRIQRSQKEIARSLHCFALALQLLMLVLWLQSPLYEAEGIHQAETTVAAQPPIFVAVVMFLLLCHEFSLILLNFFFHFRTATKSTLFSKKQAALSFFRHAWNVFDVFVFTGSAYTYLEFVIFPIFGYGTDARDSKVAYAFLGFFLSVRVFRVFGLFVRTNRLFIFLRNTIAEIYWILLSAFLVFFIFAIIGTFAFSRYAPHYFGTFSTTCFSLSIVMFSHKYYEISNSVLQEYPYGWIYFILFLVIVDLFVLDLVLAMIVEAFHHDEKKYLLEVKRRLKAAHKKLQEQHEDAMAARELLESILDNMPDPIFVKDSNHLLVVYNEAFQSLLNADPILLDALNRDAEEQVVLRTGRVVESNIKVGDKYFMTKKSRFGIVFGEDETEYYVVGVCRDISDLRSTQIQLEQLRRGISMPAMPGSSTMAPMSK